jgi:hypothetical protein
MRPKSALVLAGGLLLGLVAATQSPATAAPATQGSAPFTCSNGITLTISFVHVQRIAFAGNGAVSARAFTFQVDGNFHVDGGGGLPAVDGAIVADEAPNMNGRFIKAQSLTNTTTCSSTQTFTADAPMVEVVQADDAELLGLDPGYVGHTLTFVGSMTNTAYVTSNQVVARS